MFKKAKDIDSAFKRTRTLSLSVIVGSILLCCFTLHQSYMFTQSAYNKIYILASGQVLQATVSERDQNIEVEAKDHISNFHQLFFTLDPDDKAIEKSLSKALYLADQSAKKQYDNLKESGFYTGIISGNISQQISIDSVSVMTTDYPYSFQLYAVQKIIRPTSIVSRSLWTQGSLRNVSRSDNNPHGFLIEKWQTVQNKDLSVKNR